MQAELTFNTAYLGVPKVHIFKSDCLFLQVSFLLTVYEQSSGCKKSESGLIAMSRLDNEQLSTFYTYGDAKSEVLRAL